MGNRQSKASKQACAEGTVENLMQYFYPADGQAVDREVSPYIRGLELAIAKTTDDLEKQRQAVADCEERYLAAKQGFVAAMAIGEDHRNHEKARTWAENQGVIAMLEVDQQKRELRALEVQLELLRWTLDEANTVVESQAAAAAAAEQQQ